MNRTILVPVDFTPVTYNALQYACELSKLVPSKILAVHLLDNNLVVEMQSLPDSSIAMRKLMERMYHEIKEKTLNDLNNFVHELKSEYGDIIEPVLSHGSIYEAFDDLASEYNSSLIILGTHGITGLQHLAGSRAFKVVSNIPFPCLVVQNKKYEKVNAIYFAFKNGIEFQEYANLLDFLSNYFPGNYIINIINGDAVPVPSSLVHIADRLKMICQELHQENIISVAVDKGADVIGIGISEDGNMDNSIYGTTQEKILANKNQLPVLCLPENLSSRVLVHK